MLTTHDAAELAGFFVAHAVWCVSDGETLIPLMGYLGAKGQRSMERIEAEDLEEAVARGREELEANAGHAAAAVFIYDGYVTLGGWRTDALIVQVRAYATGGRIQFAIPYRHAKHEEGFAVYRPKILDFAADEASVEAVAQAFFAGVGEHKQGSAIWEQHLDESR